MAETESRHIQSKKTALFFCRKADLEPSLFRKRASSRPILVYKIKLLKDCYRLVYQVIDERIIIYVIAVSRKTDNEIYELTSKRTE